VKDAKRSEDLSEWRSILKTPVGQQVYKQLVRLNFPPRMLAKWTRPTFIVEGLHMMFGEIKKFEREKKEREEREKAENGEGGGAKPPTPPTRQPAAPKEKSDPATLPASAYLMSLSPSSAPPSSRRDRPRRRYSITIWIICCSCLWIIQWSISSTRWE